MAIEAFGMIRDRGVRWDSMARSIGSVGRASRALPVSPRYWVTDAMGGGALPGREHRTNLAPCGMGSITNDYWSDVSVLRLHRRRVRRCGLHKAAAWFLRGNASSTGICVRQSFAVTAATLRRESECP